MRPRKKPATKTCLVCGGTMTQPRWANGKLDSTFAKRRYCGAKCYGATLKKQDRTQSAGRKEAQRTFALGVCVKCGEPATQRHHKDGAPTNNDQANVMLMCGDCHRELHVAAGTWGRRRRLKDKTCPVCLKIFRPRRQRDVICKSATCLQEWGRRSAALRWESKTA